MDEYIFLDPTGNDEFGLVLLVLGPTGVTYASQVAGYAVEQRSAEGFVIPLGQQETEKLLIYFFEKEFLGHPKKNWTPRQMARLKQILSYVRVWKCSPPGGGKDEMGSITLDQERLDELAEAWIPVQSPYGRAVLLFKNSD